MTRTLQLSPTDRLLYFAVHPDDESLGGAGLLQQARRAGATVRVVFVTDGDFNVWPQRLQEKCWVIGATERARWARKRRAEALAALSLLGLTPGDATFLGWPDQGVLDRLMDLDRDAIPAICAEWERFQPTWVILPSLDDTHPDHSAFHVLARIAASRLPQPNPPINVLTYLIHTRCPPQETHVRALSLTPAEVTLKRQAIACHQSQMLSRRRFLAYAAPLEKFSTLSASPPHPIESAGIEKGALKLVVRRPHFAWLSQPLIYIALETLLEGSIRWELPLPSSSARVRLHHPDQGRTGRFATVRIQGSRAEIRIPIATVQPLVAAFVKVGHRPFFFDLAGWRQLPIDPQQGAVSLPRRRGLEPNGQIHE